jgi:phosphate transport system permease protein
VLLTSGAAALVVTSPTGGVMNSLPLFIYSNVRSGEPVAIERAFAAATALLAIVLILFIIARLLARPRRSSRRRLRDRLGRRPAGPRWDDAGVDLVHADPLVEMGPVQPSDRAHDTYPTDPTRESL